MPEPTDTTSDRLRRALHDTADELRLDPADHATVMRRVTRRRHRRQLAFVGGATVIAVTLVGAVVARRDSGDDTLQFSDPDTTQPESTEEVVAPSTTAITTPPTLPPQQVVGTGASSSGAGASAPVGDVTQVLPWGDGFLSVGAEYPPRPLKPVGDDIAALFPDEVNALFADGLPPTVDEATQMLSEAGLLDEVTAVINAHPEAAEAIYASDPPPPIITASYTVDGADWSTVELDPPTAAVGQFSVSGDRLVTWATDFGDDPQTDRARSATIAWTDDLTTWGSTTIDLGADQGPDEFFHDNAAVGAIAFSGDRWLARIERQTWVDYESLLPDDVRAEIASGQGYSMSTSTDGVELIVDLAEGSTTHRYTWQDLGLDGEPDDTVEPGPPVLLTGVFGGAQEQVAMPAGMEYSTVASMGDQFLLLGDTAMASDDGRRWAALEGLPDGQYVQFVVPVTDGQLFVGHDGERSVGWLRRDDGTTTDVTLPELPAGYGLWNQSPSAAWITELENDQRDSPDPVMIEADYRGFHLSLIDGPDGSSYTLTDAATGAVVQSAEIDPATTVGSDMWEFRRSDR